MQAFSYDFESNPGDYPVRVFGVFQPRKGSKIYYYRWRFDPPRTMNEAEREAIIKKYFWVSTGQENKTLAQAQMTDAFRALNSPAYWENKRNGCAASTAVRVDSASLDELWIRYIAFAGRKLSKSTIGSRQGQWRLFWTFVMERLPKVRFVHQLTPEHCSTYINEYVNDRRKSTANLTMANLCTIWRTLIALQVTATNPWEGLPRFTSAAIRIETSPPIALTDELMDICLVAARNVANVKARWSDTLILVALMMYCGLRFHEAECARGDWIERNGDNYLLKIPAFQMQDNGFMFQTKNRHGRSVPIPPPLLAILRERLTFPTAHLVFPAERWQDPKHRRRFTLANKWAAFIAEARKLAPSFPQNLNPHDLRHSYITRCHRRGVPQTVVMAWVGHRSVTVHSDYVHHDGYDPAIVEVFG